MNTASTGESEDRNTNDKLDPHRASQEIPPRVVDEDEFPLPGSQPISSRNRTRLHNKSSPTHTDIESSNLKLKIELNNIVNKNKLFSIKEFFRFCRASSVASAHGGTMWVVIRWMNQISAELHDALGTYWHGVNIMEVFKGGDIFVAIAFLIIGSIATIKTYSGEGES